MPEASSLTIRLGAGDNVAVARAALLPGTALPGEDVVTGDPVPAGHKVATRAVAPGEPLRKYGQIIGFATETIERTTASSAPSSGTMPPAAKPRPPTTSPRPNGRPSRASGAPTAGRRRATTWASSRP
jgi:hypothetical protein